MKSFICEVLLIALSHVQGTYAWIGSDFLILIPSSVIAWKHKPDVSYRCLLGLSAICLSSVSRYKLGTMKLVVTVSVDTSSP